MNLSIRERIEKEQVVTASQFGSGELETNEYEFKDDIVNIPANGIINDISMVCQNELPPNARVSICVGGLLVALSPIAPDGRVIAFASTFAPCGGYFAGAAHHSGLAVRAKSFDASGVRVRVTTEAVKKELPESFNTHIVDIRGGLNVMMYAQGLACAKFTT